MYNVFCYECYGYGEWSDYTGLQVTCDICGGTGIIIQSKDQLEALERWAKANGWVKTNG